MSPISPTLREQAFAAASRLPLVALEITHSDLAAPLRVVNNTENVTVDGDEYIAFPFEISLPDSPSDAPPRARLRIDNVSREVGQAIRSITSPAVVNVKVIRITATSPLVLGVVEVSYPGLRLTACAVDALAIEGALEFEDLIRAPFPGRTFSPAEFPGLLS